jgi:outer membrane protein assembly factor BamB
MRRLVKLLAVAAILLAGAVTAIALHRLQGEHDIRGSSTEEFTLPTTTEAPPPAPTPKDPIVWSQYGFDPTRTRNVDFALQPPYRVAWTYHAGSLVEFPPAIGYGRLFFSTNSGKFAAISAKTGKRAWKYDSHRCVAASPALGPQEGGTVFAVFLNRPPCNAARARDGRVVAFAVGNGRIRWQKAIGPSESSPLLVGDVLYVGDWKGTMWALSVWTGKTLWTFHAPGAIKGAAALSGNRLYFGAYDGRVYCLNARTGALIWRGSAQGRLLGNSTFYATPALAYGRVYIGSTDGKMYSFGATTGRRIWSHGTGGYVYASPAVWNGLVFVGSYSGWLYAFDAATGDVKWRFKANGQISGSSTVIGNVVYFATLKERTYALRASSGTLLWSFPDGKYTPTVAQPGRLFLVGYARIFGMLERR